jgi:hypothetical protein
MPQQTGDKLRVPLMILAALSMAGFVWWLSVYTEPTQTALAREEVAEVEAPPMATAEFEQQVTQLTGQQVRLEGIEVATLIGPQAFLASLPEGSILLVRILPGVAPLGVEPGQVLALRGTVRAMSPEVLDQWGAEGVYTDPAARDIAGFSVNFLEVDQVAFGGAPAPGDES